MLSMVFGCKDEKPPSTDTETNQNDNNDNNNNNTGTTGTTYKVTFNFKWNSTDFPTDYPSGPHFSPLIGWSHKTSSTFFKTGTTASDGIEIMAETGGTSRLANEMQSKINSNEGLKYVVGRGLGSGTGKIEVNINVSKDYPAVTFASMIAPSPDWYVAVVNINLYENNAFVDEKKVNAEAFDAGTDDGNTFTSSNADTNPQVNISKITSPPLGNGTTVTPAMATVTIKKQ